MTEGKEIMTRHPNVEFFFKLTRRGDRIYLSINLIPLGYWTPEDFELGKDFAHRFMAREFTELILPRLTYEPETCDQGFIERAEMARQSVLAECVDRAQARAIRWKERAATITAGELLAPIGPDYTPRYARYMACAEEAQAIADMLRVLLDRPERQGRIDP